MPTRAAHLNGALGVGWRPVHIGGILGFVSTIWFRATALEGLPMLRVTTMTHARCASALLLLSLSCTSNAPSDSGNERDPSPADGGGDVDSSPSSGGSAPDASLDDTGSAPDASSDGGSLADATGMADASFDAGGRSLDSAADGDGGKQACPVPSSGPTLHRGDVEGDEVWSANAGPHIVEQDVNVRGGATLTIEPCAEVRIRAGKNLHVAYPSTPNMGTLIAQGTADEPIHISGEDGARWGALIVHGPGTARLAHVTLENGGSNSFGLNATIEGRGDNENGADPLLFVDNVTVRDSLGPGVYLRNGASFMEDSQSLVVTESGDDATPYPLVVEEHAIHSLPSGTYTGNRKDEILIDPVGGSSSSEGLVEDATMRDLGVPYHIGNSDVDVFLIGGRADKQLVTLTIEAGVVLKFEPETRLAVQRTTSDEPSTAALRVLGTADAPVVFTSAAPDPEPGDWVGLWFGGVPSEHNVIDHARIEFAGFDCSCGLVTCSESVIDSGQHEGAVIFTEPPASAFITNTTFTDIAGNGITHGFDGPLVNFRPTNTFESVSGCEQTHPRNADTSCPDPEPVCDGL